MNFPISLHLYFYGPFAADDEETILVHYVAAHIAQTQWYQVTRCIEDLQGNPVTDHIDVGSIHRVFPLKGRWPENFNSSDEAITTLTKIVKDTKFNVRFDPNDIYILVLHDDVDAQFVCGDTCGMHGYFNDSAGQIKWIIVGMWGIKVVCDACTPPNGPWLGTTNQLVNTLVHQIVETVSDPIPPSGWYDSDGLENGKKCANNYVNHAPFRPNTSREWNIAIVSGSEAHWFLIEGNWDITTNACVMFPTQNCNKVAPKKPLQSAPHPVENGASATHLSFSVLIAALLVFVFLL